MFTPYRPVKRKLQWSSRPQSAIRFRPNPTTYVRRFNKTKVAGPSKAGTLTAQVKALQSFANKFKPEKKYFETSLAGTDIVDATGAIFRLTDVAEGTGENDRIGFTINVSDIKIALTYVRSATTVPTNAFVRFAIVVDKEQVADTSPTAANVFSGADPGAFPNVQYLERFNILYVSPIHDAARMSISVTGGLATQTNFNEYHWKGNQKVQFNGATGADIEKNGIYLCIILSGFTNTLDTTGTCRIGYTDV